MRKDKDKYIYLPFLFLLASLVTGSVYTGFMNPELRWLGNLDNIKRQALYQYPINRILICGGSSVLFGINAKLATERIDRPVINLGLHANMGGLALLGYVNQYARKGDMIILSIEPDLLAGKVESRKLGNQFMALKGYLRYAMGGRSSLTFQNICDYLKICMDVASPGLQQLINHLGKLILSRPLYRYEDLMADELGYIPKKIHQPHKPSTSSPTISAAWLSVLSQYAHLMEAKGVQVAYSLPWFETQIDI